MKPTRNALNAGCGWSNHDTRGLRAMRFGHEFSPSRPKTLSERLRERRAAEREEGREPVDVFCGRGETTARFAYFD